MPTEGAVVVHAGSVPFNAKSEVISTLNKVILMMIILDMLMPVN
jgi:hypothetical protein